MDLPLFDKELKEYLDRASAEELRNGFKYGFNIKFEGPQQLVLSKNLPSANKASGIIKQQIAKELEAQKERKFVYNVIIQIFMQIFMHL